ncbi:LAMI_0E16226g1_1 [Lachancea mirantina]|uniref:LAMI_0E16226g1_1 n=1 Tax=Lachancea mirantina TaxID=1230905 RepID=A0A1G4JSY8_9SACH|nr:LAMI_0E16226g1_1 [Lachancea mirantina]
MPNTLNVGIVGTGIFARDRHLPSYQEMPEHFRVTAAFNRTRSKAEAFAEVAEISKDKVYDNLDEILADESISFIDALLPAQFNATTVVKCVAANKPVILEKPIAATIAQAREIVKIAETTSVPVGIAENWLFLEVAKTVKKYLPKIGPLSAFTYNSTGPFIFHNKYLATSWRKNPEHIGGFLSDGGVHQLAFLVDILGEVHSVSAHTKQVRPQSGTDDVVFSTVRMKKNDLIGTFTYGSAFGSCEKSVFLKVYGLNGSLLVNLSEKRAPKVTVIIGDSAEADAKTEEFTVKEDGSFGVNAEFLNFYEAVSKKDKSLVKGSPRIAFHHLAIVAAFLESSAKNGDNVVIENP